MDYIHNYLILVKLWNKITFYWLYQSSIPSKQEVFPPNEEGPASVDNILDVAPFDGLKVLVRVACFFLFAGEGFNGDEHLFVFKASPIYTKHEAAFKE